MCTWSSAPSSSPRETCPQSLRHGQVSVQLCLPSKKRSKICVMSQACGSAPDLFYRAWPQTCYIRLNLMPLWLSETETLPHQWKVLSEEREHWFSQRLATERSDHCHHLCHFSSQEEECREIMVGTGMRSWQRINMYKPHVDPGEDHFVIILPDIFSWIDSSCARVLQTERGCDDSSREQC